MSNRQRTPHELSSFLSDHSLYIFIKVFSSLAKLTEFANDFDYELIPSHAETVHGLFDHPIFDLKRDSLPPSSPFLTHFLGEQSVVYNYLFTNDAAFLIQSIKGKKHCNPTKASILCAN